MHRNNLGRRTKEWWKSSREEQRSA